MTYVLRDTENGVWWALETQDGAIAVQNLSLATPYKDQAAADQAVNRLNGMAWHSLRVRRT